MATSTEVRTALFELIRQMAGDWEYTGPVTDRTKLVGDMALQSLDLVVLGSAIQQRYGRLPFAEFLSEIGERPVQDRDVTVGELLDFVVSHAGVNSARGDE